MLPKITLHSNEGTSNKVYKLEIVALCNSPDQYMLKYANARVGKPLVFKDKLSEPVDLETAKKEFDKVVKSKKKGKSRYHELNDDSGEVVMTEDAELDSGIRVQLLNPVEEKEMTILLSDDSFIMQEKFDGERRPVLIKDSVVKGINRKGNFIGSFNKQISEQLATLSDALVDSEDMGDHVVIFDIMEYQGKCLRNMPFMERFDKLSALISETNQVKIASTFEGNDKKVKFDALKQSNAEGVVFKERNSPYTDNRPNKGGDQIKFKFYDEASFIVMGVNAKRSVKIGLVDKNEIINVGNVTIPSNANIPEVDTIIEVRYLYAYKGGSVYQPTFNKLRNDLIKEDCVISQLKYK